MFVNPRPWWWAGGGGTAPARACPMAVWEGQRCPSLVPGSAWRGRAVPCQAGEAALGGGRAPILGSPTKALSCSIYVLVPVPSAGSALAFS